MHSPIAKRLSKGKDLDVETSRPYPIRLYAIVERPDYSWPGERGCRPRPAKRPGPCGFVPETGRPATPVRFSGSRPSLRSTPATRRNSGIWRRREQGLKDTEQSHDASQDIIISHAWIVERP